MQKQAVYKLDRVIIMGNRELAINAIRIISKNPRIEVMGILNPNDTGRDVGHCKSLKKFLKEECTNIHFIQPPKLNSEDVLKIVENFNPDLVFSLSYQNIIPKAFIEACGGRVFNIHYGYLPYNRGCLPVIWGMINGGLGVTLHLIDEGIDTGPIVSQCAILEEEGKEFLTCEDYTRECIRIATHLFDEFINSIIKLKEYSFCDQDEEIATYNSFIYPNDRWIAFSNKGKEIVNFINALTYFPHPAARMKYEGNEIQILGPASFEKFSQSEPGKIKCDDDYCYIECSDGHIFFEKIVNGCGEIVNASTYFKKNKMK